MKKATEREVLQSRIIEAFEDHPAGLVTKSEIDTYLATGGKMYKYYEENAEYVNRYSIPENKLTGALNRMTKKGVLIYLEDTKAYVMSGCTKPSDSFKYKKPIMKWVPEKGYIKPHHLRDKVMEELDHFTDPRFRGTLSGMQIQGLIHKDEVEGGWQKGPAPHRKGTGFPDGGSEETAVEISRWLYDNMEVGEPLCSLELKEHARTAFTNEQVEDNFEEAFDILLGMEGVKAYAKKIIGKR